MRFLFSGGVDKDVFYHALGLSDVLLQANPLEIMTRMLPVSEGHLWVLLLGKKKSYVYDPETGATVKVELAIFLDHRTYFEEEPESDVEDQNQVIRAGGFFGMNQDQPPLRAGGMYQITY